MASVPCARLVYNVPGIAYVALELEDGDDTSTLLGSCEAVSLKYVVKDCDPNTNEVLDDEVGYDDEYALEDVDIGLADFFQRVHKPSFQSSWDELDGQPEVEETYALSAFKSIEEATKNIVGFMGMQPCDRTDKVPEAKSGGPAHAHTILLAGLFRGQHEVLTKVRLALTVDGVTMKISVRCADEDVAQFVASSVV